MKRSKAVASDANSARAVGAPQREVDVARVALAGVVLGHERDRLLLLGGDLLGAGLVDRVLVGDPQRRPVVEVDLVLAVVALALGALDGHPRGAHLVADPAQQRLDPRPAEHRVVVVVEVGRLEAAVALLERLLVGVAEDDELELGAREGLQPALGQALQLRAQDLARGGHDRRAVGPVQVGEAERGALVPRHQPQRLEVRLHLEVAVAALPRGHRVAVDGVHLDVDGQQVVAGLGAVLEHVVQEVGRGQPFALQAALHVGQREQDGVDRFRLHGVAQLVQRERGGKVHAARNATHSSL